METWECKGRALLRYGRNVVLDVRLNRRETSKDGSGLCTQRARKQTLSRGLCGWEQFLNLVKSSQGWEAGRGQEYLSSFLGIGRSSAFSPLKRIFWKGWHYQMFSLFGELTFRNVHPLQPTSALHVAVFMCPPGLCACRSQPPPILLAIKRPLPLYVYFTHNLYVEIVLS